MGERGPQPASVLKGVTATLNPVFNTLQFPQCVACYQFMRPPGTTVQDWPGTVRQFRVGGGACYSCVRSHQADRKTDATTGTICVACKATVRAKHMTERDMPGCHARNPHAPEYCYRCGPGGAGFKGGKPDTLKPKYTPYDLTRFEDDLEACKRMRVEPHWYEKAACKGYWQAFSDVNPYGLLIQRGAQDITVLINSHKRAYKEDDYYQTQVDTCHACPVRLECLRDAYRYEYPGVTGVVEWDRTTGIRGGYTPTVRLLFYRLTIQKRLSEGDGRD